MVNTREVTKLMKKKTYMRPRIVGNAVVHPC